MQDIDSSLKRIHYHILVLAGISVFFFLALFFSLWFEESEMSWRADSEQLWSAAAFVSGLLLLIIIWSLNRQIQLAAAANRINEAAIAFSANAIAIAGMDGKITYVNPAFVALWKLGGPQDAIGRTPHDFVSHPEDAQLVINALLQRGSWLGELRARLRDGTTANLQLYAYLAKDTNGQPLSMIVWFNDAAPVNR